MAAHDYTELMSAALDGRLSDSERTAWDAHVAECAQCQARRQTLQAVDQLFAHAQLVAPHHGFTARVAARLIPRQSPRRTAAGVALLAMSAVGLGIGLMAMLAGQVGVGSLGQMGEAMRALAHWLVLLRALGEALLSLLRFLPAWGPGVALIYTGLLVWLTTFWSSALWRLTGRPVLAPAGSNVS